VISLKSPDAAIPHEGLMDRWLRVRLFWRYWDWYDCGCRKSCIAAIT